MPIVIVFTSKKIHVKALNLFLQRKSMLKKTMKTIFTTIIVHLFFTPVFSQSTIIDTEYGQVKGQMNGGVAEFLGIPFASPPVDTLRWRAPQPPESWEGLLTVQSFSPFCPQKKFEQGEDTSEITGNESCLFLNVWTPLTNAPTLPVMVFIHGGGNQQGGAGIIGGGTEIYHGKNLAERGNVVVVTIQYRLGPLGYLVHPGLEAENANGISGNYGVLDQIMALQWVKNNIAAFGGDPDNVMIFGESAGGVNVGNLMLTPMARGLFHKACIQSAIPSLGQYEEEKLNGQDFVNDYITTGTDQEKIQYLRSLPADSLIKNLSRPLEAGIVQASWRPVADQFIFSGTPQEIIERGEHTKVPLMIGSNADEMSLSAPLVVTPGMVEALFRFFVPPAYLEEGLTIYPKGSNNMEARTSFVQALTDGQFTAPVRRTARWVADNQEEPVWRYFFTHTQTGILGAYGAYHGLELFYVFNTWENSPLAIGPFFSEEDQAVQDQMLQYWVNFARTGNPNASGLADWPVYESDSDCYLEIKAVPDGSQCGLRTQASDFWDKISGFTTDVKTPATSELSISVYPNPFSDQLFFSTENRQEIERVKIYDLHGRQILSVKGPLHRLDLSGFPDGLYVLLIESKKGIIPKKVWKIKQ